MQQELFIFKKSVSQLHSAVYRNLKGDLEQKCGYQTHKMTVLLEYIEFG